VVDILNLNEKQNFTVFLGVNRLRCVALVRFVAALFWFVVSGLVALVKLWLKLCAKLPWRRGASGCD
jgi:membrane protein required for beta-lactamase induction